MRYFLLFLSLPIFVACGALIGAQSASAAPAPILKTSSLSITSADGVQNLDVSEGTPNSWQNIIRDYTNLPNSSFCTFGAGTDSTCAAYRASLISVLDDESYFYVVSQQEALTTIESPNILTGTKFIRIIFQDNNNPVDLYAFDWPWGPQLSIHNPAGYRTFCFGILNSGAVVSFGYSSSSGGVGSACTSGANGVTLGISGEATDRKVDLYYINRFRDIIYGTWPYDEDLDEDIPTSPPSPIDYTDWTPNWYISFGFDYEVTIHDTNFNTFDDNPFLCNTDLAPVIHWEIKDSSNVVLFSGTQSPTMQIVKKLPVLSSEEDYTITGIYDCGEGDLQFNQYGSLNFTLTDTGLLKQTSLEDCFQGDLPFIFDINACMSHFSSIFSLLSFGQIKLGDSWNYGNTGCGYLVVLHDWIGLPDGTQICPQFSETVRNTVTPFLSVILGLLSLGFIARLDNNKGGI